MTTLSSAQRRELAERGFVVVPKLVPAQTVAEARRWVDGVLGPAGQSALEPYDDEAAGMTPAGAWAEVDAMLERRAPVSRSNGDHRHAMWHPLAHTQQEGQLLAALATPLVELHEDLLGAAELRLAQQLVIRTDPEPPQEGEAATGWHMDFHVCVLAPLRPDPTPP